MDANRVAACRLMEEPLDEFLVHYPDLSTAEVAECCAANAAGCVAREDHPAVATLMFFACHEAAEAVYAAHGFSDTAWAAERVEHCRLIREIFGNPFRPATPGQSRS